MLNKFQIGRYYSTDSLIHRMNSTVKILCILLCVIILLFPHSIWFDFFILCGMLLLIYVSKAPFCLYMNSIFSLKYFYVSIFVLNLLCGVSIVSSFQMLLKVCIMILYSQVLVLTTSLQDMMIGIDKVLSPLKIFKLKTKHLTFCLSLAISFIPLILEQADRIMKSLTSRGIDYKKTNLRGKLSIIKAIIFPMFVLTLRRADHLAESLEVRGYTIDSNYFENIKEQWNIFDIGVFLVHVVLFIVLILGVIL